MPWDFFYIFTSIVNFFRTLGHLPIFLVAFSLILNFLWQRGEHLQKVDEVVLPNGKKKEKFIETYKKLPVIGEVVVAELDEDDEISGRVTPHHLLYQCFKKYV